MNTISKFKNTITFFKKINYLVVAKELLFFLKFFLLVIVYLIYSFIASVGHILQKIPFVGILFKPLKIFIKRIYSFAMKFLNIRKEGEISSLDLIILSVGHLKAKKNRTIITIGGMAVGFGSVIFLLSLGYGLQKLVVSRIARLGEMRQADVTIGKATSLSLDDKAVSDFSAIKGVKSVLPLVSVVSKVVYNNSVSDVIAYGVTKEFLKESAIKPSKGRIFDDGKIISSLPDTKSEGVVAGAQTERISGAKMNKKIAEITYSLHPLIWKKVYSEPSLDSEIIGYTKRNVGEQQAIEIWGNSYSSPLDLFNGVDFFDNEYSPWVKDDFPIWKKELCSLDNYDCVDEKYTIKRDGNLQQIRSGYLTEDDITLSRYKINSTSSPTLAEGEVVDKVQFSFAKKEKTPVYSKAETDAKMLMLYSDQKTSDTIYSGELIFGENYHDESGWGSVGTNKNGKEIGYWIRAKLPLWRQLDCTDCTDLFIRETDEQGNQVEAYSFIPANVTKIENLSKPVHFGQVLGDATESAQISSISSVALTDDKKATDSSILDSNPMEIRLKNGSFITATQNKDGTLDWVSMASDSAVAKNKKINELPFADRSQKVALANLAMLNMLGINEDEAIGKIFKVSLMLDNNFFKDKNYQAKSEQTEIKIIGIIPEEKTPAFYLPFSNIKNLGIENYSQLKVIVDKQNQLKGVRKEIESMGYKTSSVVDTVGRINSLFGTVRILLSILGLVALGVAALGMFNTLTVSLLEKTREVGLMKAIGMKSSEVKRLFLAESIIIGLLGGFFGLFLGVIAGYILSFLLSIISVTKGLGYVNIASVPLYLMVSIILLSFFVGVATGLYPARRATKISALNALRYE